ncbi:hypothetical protein D3C72_1612150 [compost metagenome]
MATRLVPDRLGLRLYTVDRGEHRDRAVEYTQRALHFDGEVDVPGGIDQRQAVVLAAARRPMRLHGRRTDGDAALALDRREIGGGRAVMDFADTADLAGLPQQSFGERGLAGVDVGDDAQVAPVGKGMGVGVGVGVHGGYSHRQHRGAARRRWLTGVRPGLGLGDLVHGTFSLDGMCNREGNETRKRKERPGGRSVWVVQGDRKSISRRRSRRADAPVPRLRGSG